MYIRIKTRQRIKYEKVVDEIDEKLKRERKSEIF